jgi:3' terminal RNA ribose 2'-O-methyltransferase Hen1
VSTEEVDKLVRAGGDWLAAHPDKELITRRYLSHQRSLTRSALARLAEADDTDPDELDNAVTDPDAPDAPEAAPDAPENEPDAAPADVKPLAVQRREAVLAVLREQGARRIGDFGCGEGTLVRDLLKDSSVEFVLAADVSVRALQLAARTLNLDRMPGPQRDRLKIFQTSLLYRDDRLAGLDAAVLMEVIEHVDPGRLAALEQAVFGFAVPAAVLVTTPNAEYNQHFAALPAGTMRHRDHRFEWTRTEFRDWAERVAAGFGYQPRFLPVGPEHPDHGPPTQLAVFTRQATP